MLELMTLSIMHKHLSFINDLHLRYFLLLAKHGVEHGQKADSTKTDNDQIIVLLLRVNFLRSLEHSWRYKIMRLKVQIVTYLI